MLHRLAWSSTPSASFSAACIDQIIIPSRRNNVRDHISGMLLFTGAYFLCVLEGEHRDLTDLWVRLQSDQRHCDLFCIGDDLCGSRLYPLWNTCYMADPKVDEQIGSLPSPQARADTDGRRTVALGSSHSPHTWSGRLWPKLVFPILLRADSM